MSFEKKLLKIKEISDSFENKEIALEKMIRDFETGVKLIEECRAILEETEKKIKILEEKDAKKKRVARD